jgi:hypothetical protein
LNISKLGAALHLRNDTISNQKILIDDNVSFNFLGPNLTLIDCKIVFDVTSKSLGFGEVIFQGCSFSSRKKLKNLSWCDAKIIDSKFSGVFEGNEFGLWKIETPFGAVESCDFSESILDGCRFFGCHLPTLTFPKWPNFVVQYPRKNLTLMRDYDRSNQFEIVLRTYEAQPEDVCAVTGYAPTMAKLMGLSEDDISNYFSHLPNVDVESF